MRSHHILTVGISLLTNFARERNLPVDVDGKRLPVYYLQESFQVAVEIP